MKRSIPFIFVLLLSYSLSHGQDNLWRTFSQVEFTKVIDEDLGFPMKFPKYNEEIKALDGKEITIKGYIIPLEDELGYFAFSAFPFQNCFFCGNAGIETVMEVYAKEALEYTPKAVQLKGRLKLNYKDMIEHLLYILEDAEIVE